MTSDEIEIIEHEKEALRREVAGAEQFVFERPILLVGLAMAGVGNVDTAYASEVMGVMALLLAFNLHITINRLRSSARIVAYIQYVLEENPCLRGPGWETCLRYYRSDNLTARSSPKRYCSDWWSHLKDIYKALRGQSAPNKRRDAMTYYPTIYCLHVTALVLCASGALVLAISGQPSGQRA